jgi:hypothetical protein
VLYAQAVAASNAAFGADPDGDCKYAEAAGREHEGHAAELLDKCTKAATAF